MAGQQVPPVREHHRSERIGRILLCQGERGAELDLITERAIAKRFSGADALANGTLVTQGVRDRPSHMPIPSALRSRSLRSQLAVTIALVSVIPVLFAAGILTARASTHRRAARGIYVAESADAVCRLTDTYLAKYTASVRTLADALPVSALVASGTAQPFGTDLSAQLARFHGAMGGFLTVLAARADGSIVAAHGRAVVRDSTASVVHTSVADRPYFRIPMRTGAAFVSDAFRGRGFGADAIVAVSAPLRDSTGALAGIVEGSLDLRVLGAEAGPFTANRTLAFVIVDRANRVVHASDQARYPLLTPLVDDPLVVALNAAAKTVPAGTKTSAAAVVANLSIKGQPTWGAACTTAHGWRVIARLAPATLRGDQRELLALGALVALLACIASVLIASWTAGRIAKPLTEVTDTLVDARSTPPMADELRTAEHTTRTSARSALASTHPNAAWEIVVLAGHLDDRLARAERAERDMHDELTHREHVIALRTQELSLTNESLAREVTASAAAHRLLGDSEHELGALFAAMQDVVLVLSADGTLLRVIPTSTDLLYRPPNNVLGKRIHEIFPVEQADQFLATIQRVVDTHETQTLDYTLELAHGLTWFESSASPLPNSTVLWIARDVTAVAVARAALENSERQYRMLIESASDIIYRTDADGRFVFANAAATVMLGLPRAEILGAHFTAFVRPDASEALTVFYQEQIRARADVTYREFPCVTPDGSEVWLGQKVQLMIERGRVVGMHAVARDITAQRAVERAKDDFVSLVSHELRTPLTSIKGSLTLLASGRVAEMPPTAQRLLAIASQNADRLVRLVNDILNLQRLGSDHDAPNIRCEEIAPVLHEAANAIRGIADAELVAVEVDTCDGDAWIDRDRMLQVLVNLLGNAVKFSQPGGIVTLSATREESQWRIRVRDQGRGIPASELERIFERFHQVDATDARAHAGSGLGLSICRRIVEQHSGQISATSELQIGSVFTVTLPCDPVSTTALLASAVLTGATA